MSGTVNEIQEHAARIEMVTILLLTTQRVPGKNGTVGKCSKTDERSLTHRISRHP